MRTFCFLCGKKTENLIEGYCEECYNKKFSLVKLPKGFSIITCSKCGLIKIGNKWQEFKLENFFKREAKIFGKIKKLEIKRRNNNFKIICTGNLKGSKKLKVEVHEISVKFDKIVCPKCSRIYGGYYEAILQLRGKIEEKILDFISEKNKKLFLTDKKAFYRTKEKKEGVNLYFGSKRAANKIAIELKNKFNCKIKKSFKLVTKKEGKDVYRTIILVRI